MLEKGYFFNDKLQGSRYEFYPSGQLKAIWQYNKSKIEGEVLKFDKKGKLIYHGFTRDGNNEHSFAIK